MFLVDLKRIIRAGTVSFLRNGFVSLASVLVMVVTLSVIGSVVFLLAVLDTSLAELKSKVDVNVYFLTSAAETDILALKRSLGSLPEVSSVEYVSREEELESFRKRHEGDARTLQALEELGENPFGAKLNVRAKEPSQYESVAAFLKGDAALSRGEKEIIDEVNYYNNKAAIDRLTKINASAETLGFALSIILLVVSAIIAFNTIRLAIFISRDEIAVMRLVGASNRYIRGPFVVAGILYGVIAAVVTLAALYPMTYWLGDATGNFFGGFNLFRYYLSHLGTFFLLIVGAGAGLGAVSSWLAVRRYLNV